MTKSSAPNMPDELAELIVETVKQVMNTRENVMVLAAKHHSKKTGHHNARLENARRSLNRHLDVLSDVVHDSVGDPMDGEMWHIRMNRSMTSIQWGPSVSLLPQPRVLANMVGFLWGLGQMPRTPSNNTLKVFKTVGLTQQPTPHLFVNSKNNMWQSQRHQTGVGSSPEEALFKGLVKGQIAWPRTLDWSREHLERSPHRGAKQAQITWKHLLNKWVPAGACWEQLLFGENTGRLLRANKMTKAFGGKHDRFHEAIVAQKNDLEWLLNTAPQNKGARLSRFVVSGAKGLDIVVKAWDSNSAAWCGMVHAIALGHNKDALIPSLAVHSVGTGKKVLKELA